MVMIELSETEKPRAPPPPTFSAPFASPSLRWACKKRLRCFHPDAAALSLSPSPSPDRPPRRPLPPLFPDGPHTRPRPCHAAPAPSPSPSPSPSPPPPSSARCKILIRLPSPRSRDDEEGEPPLGAAPPDPPSRAGSDGGRAREEASRRRSDGVGMGMGWSLRSGVRGGEKGKKKRRKVELWVSLSRDEIEEDFLWMTGAKPPRRSRRRDRGASDHLLMGVFPGSWMPNRVTAARYRVAEPSDPRKD